MALSSEALMAVALCSALAATGSASAEDKAKKVDEQSRSGVAREGAEGFLGVSLQEVTKADTARLKLPAERGALVQSVEPGSPAEKAGLKVDDVILRFQGEDIRSVRQLARLVREEPAGRAASIEVSREGALQKLQAQLEAQRKARRAWRFEMPDLGRLGLDRDVELGEVPEPPEPPEPPSAPEPPSPPRTPLLPRVFLRDHSPRRLGIEYQEIGAQLAKYFKLSGDEGVLVARVEEDGPAARAGVKAGDIILKLAGRPVKDGGDLRQALDTAGAGAKVTLSLQRDGKPLDIELQLGGSAEQRRRGETS